jgi:20S proteasome alpha/beta subunit
MTIAVGFSHSNGMVLCTDSLESDGATKKQVDKIRGCVIGDEWGYALTCAGESDLASTFSKGISETLGNGEFDRDAILLKVRKAISATRKSYPRGELAMLFALHSKQSLKYPMPVCELYRLMDESEHLAQVDRFQAIGIGAHLSHFLLKNLYDPRMSLEELEELGIFVVSQAIEHVDGCGGPIQAITYRMGEWQWRPVKKSQIETIASKYTVEGLKAALQEYWKSKKN